MTKAVIFIFVLLISSLTFTVYQVEQRVQSLNQEMRNLNAQIEKDSDTIRILKAEWSYLNSPERVNELASSKLDLQGISSDQIQQIEDIPLRSIMVGYSEN